MHVEHSYLNVEEFSFAFLTNKYISIELVQWKTIEQREPAKKQRRRRSRMQRKKPEAIGKGTK